MPHLENEKEISRNAEKSAMKVDDAMLWKRRYQTSKQYWKKSEQQERTDKIIKYLNNDYHGLRGNKKVFLNQFFITLKTLLPIVVAHNPFVAVNPENDVVYEYDSNGQPLTDETGQPIRHNVIKASETLEKLLKRRLTKVVRFKREMRKFLRDALTFNRGIFLTGHTVNTGYNGSFNEPTFHAYIKAVPPYRIKRQAGTTRIDEGTYFFYEYELPVSHLKDDDSYNQNLLKQCKTEILTELDDPTDDDFVKEQQAGFYDDVLYYKLRNAYDLLTGEIFVFADGCDFPVKTIKPEYDFKNPSTEFVPNELFQPERKEPISDLMMGEQIVKNAHDIVTKAVDHVRNFNAGYDMERRALLKESDKRRIQKGLDRSFRVWENGAVSGQWFRQRPDVPLGPEPLNMVEYLFGYFEKILSVFNFQQGGGAFGEDEDETATKTQAKLQSAQLKGGDMSEMLSDSINEALDKYLSVLIDTTDESEVVDIIGDAGEVEYRNFSRPEAKRGKFYTSVDIQSMAKVNEDVKIQQALKFYEILKADPDPLIQAKFDKLKLVEKIAEGLKLNQEGIIKKTVDTKGLSTQDYKENIKQDVLKAKKENAQAQAGAEILPPAVEDDDDIHLEEHLTEATKLRQQIMSSVDPLRQQEVASQLQPVIEKIANHAKLHIERKKQQEQVESRTNEQFPGGTEFLKSQVPKTPVSPNPPRSGNLSGQAAKGNGGLA